MGQILQLVHQERNEIHDLIANLLVVHVDHAELQPVEQVVHVRLHRSTSLVVAKAARLFTRCCRRDTAAVVICSTALTRAAKLDLEKAEEVLKLVDSLTLVCLVGLGCVLDAARGVLVLDLDERGGGNVNEIGVLQLVTLLNLIQQSHFDAAGEHHRARQIVFDLRSALEKVPVIGEAFGHYLVLLNQIEYPDALLLYSDGCLEKEKNSLLDVVFVDS